MAMEVLVKVPPLSVPVSFTVPLRLIVLALALSVALVGSLVQAKDAEMVWSALTLVNV